MDLVSFKCPECKLDDKLMLREQRYNDLSNGPEFNIYCWCTPKKDLINFEYIECNPCARCGELRAVGLKHSVNNSVWVQCRNCYNETEAYNWSNARELKDFAIVSISNWNKANAIQQHKLF